MKPIFLVCLRKLAAIRGIPSRSAGLSLGVTLHGPILILNLDPNRNLNPLLARPSPAKIGFRSRHACWNVARDRIRVLLRVMRRRARIFQSSHHAPRDEVRHRESSLFAIRSCARDHSRFAAPRSSRGA